MVHHAVVGVDAGGTSTRCAVVSLSGEVLACSRTGGANLFSGSDPAAAVEAALGSALEEAGDTVVDGGVFGIAGAASAGYTEAVRTVSRVWAVLGLTGTPHVTDDIAVAFASGSAASAGTVLIAGTGAVAAVVRDGAVVRRCDGYGWLLGDEGSAVWIALAGLRSVLAAIDGRGRPTVLGDRLAEALKVTPGDARQIVRAVHSRPPAELGALAPEVTLAASGGDAVAEGIVADAAARLLTNLESVAPRPMGTAPVVLAGALLAGGPVADAVQAGLRARHGVAALSATDGAVGAAGLALRRAGASSAAHSALLAAANTPMR